MKPAFFSLARSDNQIFSLDIKHLKGCVSFIVKIMPVTCFDLFCEGGVCQNKNAFPQIRFIDGVGSTEILVCFG